MKFQLFGLWLNALIALYGLVRVLLWALPGTDFSFRWSNLCQIFFNGLVAAGMWIGYKAVKYRKRMRLPEPPQDDGEEEAEDTDLEVARYGLRTFRVRTRGEMRSQQWGLRSVVKSTYWTDGVMEAKCMADARAFLWSLHENEEEHVIPDKNCSCGIYATTSLDSLMAQYPAYALSGGVAVIAAEGPTIIGELGMRTTAARIVAYWCPDKKKRKVYEEVCQDARHFRNMSDMLEAYNLPPCPSFPVGSLETHIARRAFGI